MGRIPIALLLVVAGAAGCSNETTTPAAPSPLNVAGTWAGDLTLQGSSAQMKWTLTQTGAAVSGPVLVLLPSGIVLLNGVLSGTLAGSTLTYTIAVSSGGIPSNPACTGQLGGTASVAPGVTTTMTGAYGVNASTCTTGGFTNGSFTLMRQ